MKKRILFSYAHPDDETFTAGGLLAKYSKREDVETIIYSATLGDAGKCGNPPVCRPEELADVRKAELEKACQILGVDHLITGPYGDGKLADLPDGELEAAVKEVIDKYKPEVVVTFPPHGISGHRDHIAIQEATFRAITSDIHTSVRRLFYVTVASKTGKIINGSRTIDDIKDIDIIMSYSQDEIEVVRKALLAHQTQHLSLERIFPGIYEQKGFSKTENKEFFILSWSKITPHEPLVDLI